MPLIPHDTTLITTISVALALAFVCGFVVQRIGLPAIVGYLFAGVLVGPFTPGFVADEGLAPQLAEIGVILLMFGVGIHFSLRNLLGVRGVAVPGAILHKTVIMLLSVGVAYWWGWGVRGGIVLGLALSIASTVVLLRALMAEDLLDSTQGRVVVGWLIVEDLLTVLALVLLPLLVTEGTPGSIATTLAWTLGKVVALIVVVVVVGRRLVPWLLVQVARTGSRELFTLSVLVLAFGVALGSSALFGVSMALGAFLAGLVMSESDLSHRAAEEALPMRDAFAVLFFTSVGMLFDPSIVLQYPGQLVGMIAIIVVAKFVAAYAIVVMLGRPERMALVAGAGLAQIGEFSFILAEIGDQLGLIPREGRSLILAAAIVSIAVNPFLFRLLNRIEAWLLRDRAIADSAPPAALPFERLVDHVVLCGYGRVGRLVGAALEAHGVPYLVIEQDRGAVEELRGRGIPAYQGDAADHSHHAAVSFETARLLVIAIPDPIASRLIAEEAREHHPGLPIVARTHSEEEWVYLSAGRVTDAIFAEHELAQAMLRVSLRHLGIDLPADAEDSRPTASLGAGLIDA